MEADDSSASLNHYEISQKILSGEFSLCHRVARSKVWETFSRIVDQNSVEIKEYVYCKTCEKVFKYNKVSTSNLVKHKCYILKNAINAENTISAESANSTVEFETTKYEIIENVEERSSNNLTKLITKWIVKDCRTYDLLQSDSLKAVFQELLRLGSKFGGDVGVEKLLPSSQAVAKNVDEMYEQCFWRVKSDIAAIKENGFGLTAYICRDDFMKKSYVCLTVHFLKNGCLKWHLLGLRSLEGEKGLSQKIHEKVESILKDFDCQLSSKSIIVTQGDDDVVKAFQDTQSITSISHLLNNALQRATEEVPEVAELLTACAKLVNSIKTTELNAPLKDSLQGYSPTRWNTIYKMLSSIETNWSEISKTMKNDKQLLKTINIKHLKAVTKTLQPFEEAIETLEEDNVPTLHLVVVYLHELRKSCDTNDSEFKDFDFIESYKENLRFYLETIVSENITMLHKLALFLYPPTNKLLQFSDKEKKSIEAECIRLMKGYKSDDKPIVKQEADSVHRSPVSKRKKLFSDFVEPESSRDPNTLIIQELQFYKNTRVVNSADFDVFSWWELQKNNFPLLYKLSCTVLTTPATSAASQRIFSTAGNLLCERAHDVCSKAVDMERIIFVNSNEERYEVDSNQ